MVVLGGGALRCVRRWNPCGWHQGPHERGPRAPLVPSSRNSTKRRWPAMRKKPPPGTESASVLILAIQRQNCEKRIILILHNPRGTNVFSLPKRFYSFWLQYEQMGIWRQPSPPRDNPPGSAIAPEHLAVGCHQDRKAAVPPKFQLYGQWLAHHAALKYFQKSAYQICGPSWALFTPLLPSFLPSLAWFSVSRALPHHW